MSTKIKDERVDARILSMCLSGDEVLEALRDYVLKKAKVHDYEREYVDKTRSTVGIHVGSQTVRDPGGADVTVYVDRSREPKCAEAVIKIPDAGEVARLINKWNYATNVEPIEVLVQKIQDLCR